MGFGSSGSMNVVLKNNRNLLNNHRRKKFKNSLGSYAFKKKPEFNLPKATPRMLRPIRERLQFDNERIRKRRIIAILSIAVVLIAVFVTVMFN